MEMEIAMGPWDLESARKTSRRGRFPCPMDLELHEKMLDSTVSRTVPSKPLSTDQRSADWFEGDNAKGGMDNVLFGKQLCQDQRVESLVGECKNGAPHLR